MRAAVVVNPTKHADGARFRAEVTETMAAHGWNDPLWLETTPDETGRGLAAAAVAERVNVVLASGGDGTVTACAEGVAGSGVPLGVLPAGTGNLLARNLGLPLTLDQALAVALTGRDRGLDVGHANGHLFVAMAGIGFDAMLLDSTGEPLKKRLGWVAYAVSALRHLRARPVRATLRADGGRALRRRASGIIVGNVGGAAGRAGPAAAGGAGRRGARPHGADRPGLVRLAGPGDRRDGGGGPGPAGWSAASSASCGSSWTGRSCGNSTARSWA